jgi:hypothetical protein
MVPMNRSGHHWNIRRPHPFSAGFAVAAVVWCIAIALGRVEGAADAVGWWAAPLPDPYVVSDYGTGTGFFFSPPIAYVFFPFSLLPWPIFAAAWTAIMFAALYLLVGRWSAFALLLPPIWWELNSANLALPIGVAVVLGFRWPAAWSFVLLTKVTPGVGLLWFAVRREWRSLAIALAATLLIVAVTFVATPHLWFKWAELLIANAGASGPGYFTIPVPLPARLVVATAIVTWGARSDRRWTVVVAATLGSPVLWYNALATLAAVVPLTSRLDRAASPLRAIVGDVEGQS